MRIALDTNGLFTTQAGVARYIRGLLKGFERAAVPQLNLSTLAWEVENYGYRQPQRAFRTAYRDLIWSSFVAPARLRSTRADLLHSTVTCLVRVPTLVRHVVTLHDLAGMRYPRRYRRWQSMIGRVRRSRLPRADRVLCISRFTADEAMALLSLPANKLEVVYNGCDFHPDEPPAPEEPPDGKLPAEFLLFVGSLEPGKNLSLLKAAYAHAEARDQSLPPLLIVGARWEGVAHEGPPPRHWHYLGRLPDPVLVYLYRRALALVFPSKYEGFGLPVAEAMGLGCPVICSRVASLPEVGGTAPLYAEMNPGSYVSAIRQLLASDALRAQMIEQGYQQARRFSWKKCAEETAAVYQQACA